VFFAGSTDLGSGRDIRAGWTVGAGLEGAILGRWTVKVEYLERLGLHPETG
jgi:opacity protein-like surface antigen